MIRVILTDDHKLIRDGLKALLNGSDTISVIGEAADGNELLELLQKVQADVVLLDINMPGKNGIETTRELHLHYPELKVLVLSMLDHERYVHQMIEAGASGYVLKNAGKEELTSAIQLVAAGVTYISPEVAIDMLKKLQVPDAQGYHTTEADKIPRDLTRRELEVLALISEGFTNAEIAEKLFTSKRTVETHRQNLLEKTQTNNTATLIRFALRNGIIS
ncbi:response regulator transcription factor [Pontibacter sp. 172403-2]|uniref:response regulator n=1 Tax=Pontibacter rufus TaxID=2791028 RepID=UPI0018AF7903|nr:response regulator transcription factor [Pontibacter sp. 172403-2]MBF9254451.1 response regulator transcription factor [Pontibacter sp. 172403-2]